MKKTILCVLAACLLLCACLVFSPLSLKPKDTAAAATSSDSTAPKETPDDSPGEEGEAAASDDDNLERDLQIHFNSPRGQALLQAVEDMDSIPDLDLSGSAQSLNDIRFDGWTREDFFGNNDYLRAFRRYMDTWLQGKKTDAAEADPTALLPYKARLSGKFLAMHVREFTFGGLLYKVTPIDDSALLLDVWIYSVVDDDGHISAYQVQYVEVVTDFEEDMRKEGITKEDMRKVLLEHVDLETLI